MCIYVCVCVLASYTSSSPPPSTLHPVLSIVHILCACIFHTVHSMLTQNTQTAAFILAKFVVAQISQSFSNDGNEFTGTDVRSWIGESVLLALADFDMICVCGVCVCVRACVWCVLRVCARMCVSVYCCCYECVENVRMHLL